MTAQTLSRRLERDAAFKYLLIAPAVFVILLIGLYPLVKLAVTSFQDISMFGEDRSFQGALNYARPVSYTHLTLPTIYSV